MFLWMLWNISVKYVSLDVVEYFSEICFFGCCGMLRGNMFLWMLCNVSGKYIVCLLWKYVSLDAVECIGEIYYFGCCRMFWGNMFLSILSNVSGKYISLDVVERSGEYVHNVAFEVG
jgi:hypothetical protein